MPWITDSEVSDLARINKIRPPYSLEVGQKLRLSGSAPTKTAATRRKTSSSSAAIAKQTPPPGAARCWRWPTSGRIVQAYSNSDGGNKGIDIAGKRGQPIYASAKGKVVYVGNQLRGYGNLIMIKHGEDFITAYAHNDTTLVRNGRCEGGAEDRHHGQHRHRFGVPALPDPLPRYRARSAALSAAARFVAVLLTSIWLLAEPDVSYFSGR